LNKPQQRYLSSMEITIGNLIDQLTIVNLKIWMLEDIKRDSEDDAEIAEACRKTNSLNPQRNQLIAAIDEKIDGKSSGLNTKIYGKKK